ncbi:MAG: branched-chain amino acid ABC transporter permease [Betaproteobacteria bacterium]|nr:branched-chain amino acid ABC transporter permease [Betaproteobacteria bacterium]MDE2209791.1 branched-chain amino acid ABC transporter permease [Betaproteobacteria bacterium]MDE2357810.1 branched-chain amino acid ABC transporter permease [Betaproteobacteria bacterium]
MTFPSGTLLAQSALSGVFIGSLYGLLGLGVGLAWGLLHVINLAHFAFAFLAAYLCYQLASVGGMDPLLTLALIVPLFAALGAALQWLLDRFEVSPLNSLLATFGITAIIEAGIQWAWTADFRKLESVYAGRTFKVGALFVPLPELLTLLLSLLLAFGIWAAMRYTNLGRALRALAEDAPIAAAFGINRRAHALVLAGVCGALAGIAGVCLALTYTLTPSQIYAWVGVVFAAVMLGGLGSALGPLVGGIAIGVSEAVTMAFVSPSWAPLVSFSLLIGLLLLKPGRS